MAREARPAARSAATPQWTLTPVNTCSLHIKVHQIVHQIIHEVHASLVVLFCCAFDVPKDVQRWCTFDVLYIWCTTSNSFDVLWDILVDRFWKFDVHIKTHQKHIKIFDVHIKAHQTHIKIFDVLFWCAHVLLMYSLMWFRVWCVVMCFWCVWLEFLMCCLMCRYFAISLMCFLMYSGRWGRGLKLL